jgi:uncharacterized SAM-binding protein YcdF (DUF218 family)
VKRALRLTVRAAAALAVLAVVWLVANLVYVWRTGEGDQTRPVDAIVVMGAAQYDGRPSHQLAARLDHVVELWNRGVAPMVITTGSKRSGDRFTEAHASAVYLEQHGVPANVIVEVGGATSYDSIAAAARLLQGGMNGHQLERVLLVSDAYHSLRIRLVAEERGLTAYVSPTRTSPVRGWSVVRLELKEAAGVALGRLIGFDRLLQLTG